MGWNRARERALAYRAPRKRKPLVVEPDTQTVALVRNRDYDACKGCGYHVCSCNDATALNPDFMHEHKLAWDKPYFSGMDFACDDDHSRDAKAYEYRIVNRPYVLPAHLVSGDAQPPRSGTGAALVHKHVQDMRESIDRATSMPDTLPPGWEAAQLGKEGYRHTSGAVVWRWSKRWYQARSESVAKEDGAEGAVSFTRAEAMDAALALVPVGAEREGWYEEKERPGMLRYMEPRNAGVILDRYGRWCGGGAYYDTQLDAQLAVEAKYREQSQ